MEIQDFWNIYGGGHSAAEFVWRFGKGNAEAGVSAYIASCPAMFGIVRHRSWKATFTSREQYNRERVAAALLTHLELTREDWECHVQEYAAAEAEARIVEQKRREAEALAAALAQVEAEARKAEAGTLAEPESEACQTTFLEPSETDDLHRDSPEFRSVYDSGLAQARTPSDAEAIAAAMARVEAEAKARAAEEASELQPNADEAVETAEAPSDAGSDETAEAPPEDQPEPDGVSNP